MLGVGDKILVLMCWTSFLLGDPRLWGEDAAQFNPERFLPEFNPRAKELLDVNSVVFGFGRRWVSDREPINIKGSLLPENFQNLSRKVSC